MSPEPRQVVEGYLDAVADFDYERARASLSDVAFTYRSPISVFSSADDFVAHLSLSGGIIQRMRRRKVFVDGEDVCHILEFVVQVSDKRTVSVAQWARVVDGRICSIELIFDAHEYYRLFDPDSTESRPPV